MYVPLPALHLFKIYASWVSEETLHMACTILLICVIIHLTFSGGGGRVHEQEAVDQAGEEGDGEHREDLVRDVRGLALGVPVAAVHELLQELRDPEGVSDADEQQEEVDHQQDPHGVAGAVVAEQGVTRRCCHYRVYRRTDGMVLRAARS